MGDSGSMGDGGSIGGGGIVSVGLMYLKYKGGAMPKFGVEVGSGE